MEKKEGHDGIKDTGFLACYQILLKYIFAYENLKFGEE